MGGGKGSTYLVESEHEIFEPGHVRLLRPHVLPCTVPITTNFHRFLVIRGGRSKSRDFGWILRSGHALPSLLHISAIRTGVLPRECLLKADPRERTRVNNQPSVVERDRMLTFFLSGSPKNSSL